MSATAQKRIIVAVNPSASFGANKSVGATVVNRLKELGHDATMLVEKDYQKLIATAKATIASKPDALVVVGGDGMVNLGTNLVAGTTVPLGIIPSGTGNDTARSLGIPIDNFEASILAVHEALERPARLIDAGVITAADGTSRWFACMVSAGFDSVVNERANQMQYPKGKSRYTIALLLELVRIKPIHYRLVLDGTELKTQGMMVSIGNGESLGGGMKVTPTALVDDGLLDVLVVGALSRFAFLRIFPRVFKGEHLSDPRVSVTKVKTVRLEGDGVVAYTDGERFAPLPVDVEVKPGSLYVLAPAV